MEIGHIDRVEASYRRLHPRLWRALFAYSRDRDLATEAEAEAFAQALRRAPHLRNVDAWTWRAAFRIMNGLLAKRGTATTVAEPAIWAVSEDSSLTEFISQLAELSDQQRAIVVLRYVGQFKPAEIADLLDTTSGSVRVQLHRAHEKLRLSMEQTHG